MSLADTFRHTEGTVRLRANWVVPVDMPPIRDGEVHIENGEITWVGKASGREPTADFRMSAILPGLVNVHAHLEYTVMRGLLEDIEFFPWIRTLTALKAHLSLEDWIASASLGAGEMLAGGITTVADASDAGAALTAILTSGQRGIVFREVFGIEKEPSVEQTLSVLKRRLGDMRLQVERHHAQDRVTVGVSPHAPYTVRPQLVRALAAYCGEHDLRQTIHVAESPAETQLIREGSGEFAQMFARRNIAWEAPGTSPVRHVADCGGFEAPTLAVHCVHADAADAALLREKGVSVAHCPKSNGKLGAGFAPVRMLLDAGVTVGLGTDSVAANNGADLLEEMRYAVHVARAREHTTRALTAREALYMATLGGATALGLQDQVGGLRRGKRADLCVVRLDGLHVTPAADDDPISAIVYGARASDVLLTMVDGRVLYESGNFIMLDIGHLRAAVTEIRRRLRREAAKILGSGTTSG
jgi:5-methylthioadenosine/S-adenosylhomocysteine deaminase